MIKIYESDNNTAESNLPDITEATLLSVDEAEKYLNQDERKYNTGWWLCSPNIDYSDAAIAVNNNGNIYYPGYYVDSDVCTRPALKINLKSSNLSVGDTFEINGYGFKVISNTLAWLYNSDIGKCAFREDYESQDANDYNKSDVKKYVDNWFNTEIKPYI